MRGFGFFLILILQGFSFGFGQINPGLGPENPAFIKYLNSLNGSGYFRTVHDHDLSLGAIPPPTLPVFTGSFKKSNGRTPTTLPSSYDLRLLNKVTPVRDQEDCNSCWSFATCGSIESRWKVLGMSDNDLSEDNLNNCHLFSISPCEGGNARMSSAYLSRFSGPISEAFDIYSGTSGAGECPFGLTPIAYISDSRFLPKDITTVKESIMEYGALYTSFRWEDPYYNQSNFTYYYEGSLNNTANHAVTLVGWDDTIITNGGAGAWIVKNSWGVNWPYGIPSDAGYFYISYNDPLVNSEVAYFPLHYFYDNSSKVYGYDDFGWVQDFGFSNSIGYALVKFIETREEQLTKVSVCTNTENTIVDIEFYNSFDGSTLSGYFSGLSYQICDFPGYHTFDLPLPISRTPGQSFYVKVKYSAPGTNTPIPVEMQEPGYSMNATIQWGKCWASADGVTWSPLGIGTLNQYDLCIKTYTTAVPSALSAIEYFLDTDPGFGNGTEVVTQQAEITMNNLNIPLNGVTQGIHVLNFRAKNNQEIWGQTQMIPFYNLKSDLIGITNLEYFFDNDPGFGNAANIIVASPSNNITQVIAMPLTNVPEGIHTLYIRAKDNNAYWSLNQTSTFYKFNNIIPQISKLEYFIDFDPGIGNGTPLTVANSDNITKNFIIDLSSVSSGIHVLYIRAKDQNGKWSITSVIPFYRIFVSPQTDISKVEFFIDQDPGLGLGVNVPVYQPAPNVQQTFTVDLSGYATGSHKFYLRTQDNYLKWSLTSIQPFDLPFSLITPSQNQTVTTDTIQFSWTPVTGAVKYRLYVDNNSGFGSCEISDQHIPALKNLTVNHYTISGNWLSDNLYYWKVKVIMPSDSFYSNTGVFTYSPLKSPSPQWVPIYRAYLPGDVDHFYCTSLSHLETAIDKQYRFESVEGYLSIKPFEVSSPDTLISVYRFWVKGSAQKENRHYYTTSESDKDNRIIQGWLYEGISGYTYNRYHQGLVKLYHTYLDQSVPDIRKDNFYTVSNIERQNSISHLGYSDQGFTCYVSAIGYNMPFLWLENQIPVGFGINPINGNLSHISKMSFSIPEGRVSLNFTHFYNSGAVRLMNEFSPLGNGWTHSYNAFLNTTDSLIYLFWPGEINVYNKFTLHSLTPGVYDILTKVNPLQYQIKKKDQVIYTFNILDASMDSTAFLKQIIDRNGNTITLNYNSARRLISVKSPANRYISFTYYNDPDKDGLIHYVKDSLALNRTVEFNYDMNRNLTYFRDAKNQVTTYEYEMAKSPFDHFLKKINLPDGTSILNHYDSLTRRIGTQSINYQNSNSVVSINVPMANQVNVTDEMGRITQFYSSPQLGNIIKLSTPSGEAYFLYIDSINNPTKPTRIIDGMGYNTDLSYDIHGNTLTIIKPYGISHLYQYNSFNDITQYNDPRGKVTSYGYTNGNLTSVQNPRGTTSISYFSDGMIQNITDPLNHITTISYNAFRNIQSIIDNLGHTTHFNYDNASRQTGVTNANNQTITYAYDNNDLVTTVTDANGKATLYSYNPQDQLIGVTDAKSHTTSLGYNSLGLVNSIQNVLGNQKSMAYYDNSLIHTFTNPKNQSLTYTYDNSNRLTGLSGSGINYSYLYNNNDIVSQTLDNSGMTQFSYDSLNRLVTCTFTDNLSSGVSYTYDKSGNIKSLTYPGSKTVNYSYYDDNLLHTVIDWNNHTTEYFYLSDESFDSVHNANGTTTKYYYDGANRLTGLKNSKSDGTIINRYTYLLDALGNQITIDQIEPFETSLLDTGVINYIYNNANRIQTAGTTSFLFDNNGNTIQKNENGVTNYVYDVQDHLSSVSGQISGNYTYDLFGNRRKSVKNSTTTRYILDINGPMSNVLMETDENGNPTYYYIYGLGLISRIKASDNSTGYYHCDSRGSTIAMTDQAQNITHKYGYDAFGKILQKEEADFNPFRYVGKYGVMYEDSTLYFMRARYYNPKIGRFLSEDPLWSTNLYPYSGNNPIVKIDPSGKNTFIEYGAKLSIQLIKGKDFFYNSKLGAVTFIKRNTEGQFIDGSTKIIKVSKFFEDLLSGWIIDKYADMCFGKGETPAVIEGLSNIPIPYVGSIIKAIFGHVHSAGGDIDQESLKSITPH